VNAYSTLCAIDQGHFGRWISSLFALALDGSTSARNAVFDQFCGEPRLTLPVLHVYSQDRRSTARQFATQLLLTGLSSATSQIEYASEEEKWVLPKWFVTSGEISRAANACTTDEILTMISILEGLAGDSEREIRNAVELPLKLWKENALRPVQGVGCALVSPTPGGYF
jgi:hypothetical protein